MKSSKVSLLRTFVLKSRVFRNNPAFTILEILIVIAVLGLLAVVAVPQINTFLVAGKVAAANSELAAVRTAAHGYANDYLYSTAEFSSDDMDAYIIGGHQALKGVYHFFANGLLDETGNQPVYYTSTDHTQIDTSIVYNSQKHQFVRN